MRALVLIIAFVATTVSAQSNLPACVGDDASRWSNCFGTLTSPNGVKYVGEFLNGKYHGQGTSTFPDGRPAQAGIWENDKFVRAHPVPENMPSQSAPRSPTVATLASIKDLKNIPFCNQGSERCYGAVKLTIGGYVGEFMRRQLHGKGTLTFTNGDKYVGEFREGNITGLGVFESLADNQWKSDKYVGEFREGKFHGQGAYTFGNGSPALEGIWNNHSFVSAKPIPESMAGLSTPKSSMVAPIDNIKELKNFPLCNSGYSLQCFGSYNFSNGAKYVGEFMRPNYPNQGNKGTLTFANGDKYEGEFRAGNVTGQGTFYSLADNQWKGDKYAGEFKEGKFHGQGSYIFANGSPTLEGIWDNHTFVSAQRIPDHIADKTASLPPSGAPPTNNIGHFPGAPYERYAFAREPSTPEPMANRAPAAPTSVATPPPRQAEPPRSTLALSLSISQPDAEGFVSLTITTNSDTASLKINGDEAGGREDGRYLLKRFAQLGNNTFDIVAQDRLGNTQRQSIAVSRRAADSTVRFSALNPTAVRARPANNAVAIIIGIQNYSRVPKAEFANNDARVFYDYAIRGLGVRPENIKILLDQEANDIDILGAFKNWLPLKTRRGQTDVYVFYSGHGLPSDDGSNLYMLPHGVDRQFLDRTAIKQSELITSLQAVSPRSVTMFMDACYSGQIRTGETLLASARPIAIQSKASSFPANFNVISASAPDQLASSSPDLKHGVFSYFLMKGMEGEADENKDGNITMAEMQSYLKEYVGKKAMSLNRTQVPQSTGDQSRVLVSR